MSLPKWTEERTETLVRAVGSARPVAAALVDEIAEKLETSSRSVASKLRKMGIEVASVSKEVVKTFSDDETSALAEFVNANPNKYTYAEIAAVFADAKFTAKQIQGKILSLELNGLVNRAPEPEVVRSYSDDETATFIKLANSGAFLEDIASAMGRSLNSVRGKALSLSRAVQGFKIPKQKQSYAKESNDPIESLGDVSGMTVAEIAAATGKSERGIKTILTHRALVAKDYDGAKRAAKLADKEAA